MAWGRCSRAAASRAALVVIAASAPAGAQERDVPAPAPAQSASVLELQFGGGYLVRDGDLASLPDVEVGAVLWWSESWGVSMLASTTIGEHMASYDYGDGTRTGGRTLRRGTVTLRYRRTLDSAVELNVGAGLTAGAYDHLTWHPDAGPNPRPEVWNTSIGGLVGEVLVGKRVAPRLSIKAGVVVYPFLDERTAVAPVAFAVVSF